MVAGIAWQIPPHICDIAEHGNGEWVVQGCMRTEIPGTAGWRLGKKSVYLQDNLSWGETLHRFSSKEQAEAALAGALGEQNEPAPDTALAAALRKAKKK